MAGIEPITGFSWLSNSSDNTSSNSFKLPSPSKNYTKKKTGFTLAQYIAAVEAAKAERGGSFVDTLKGAGGDLMRPVNFAFDKLMRPTYAIAGGTNAYLSGKDVSDAAVDGFTGKVKMGFGEVLENQGVLKNHDFLRGAAGLGLDILTDPLTYASFGTAGAIKGGAGAAVKHISAKGLLEGVPLASKEAATLSRSIKVLENAGPEYTNRLSMGRLRQTLSEKPVWTEADRVDASAAKAAAHAEGRLYDPRTLTAGLQIPFTRGGGLKFDTKIPVPKGKLGNLPTWAGGGVASSLGKAFKPGYEDPILHAQLLSRRHVGERLFSDYTETVRNNFKGLENIPEKDQHGALHFFEKIDEDIPAVIKDGDGYILNPAKIKQAEEAGLSKKQLAFVTAMHNTGEYLATKSKEAGVEFNHLGEKGQLYVPHVVKKDGSALSDAQRNLLTKRGWLNDRTGALSVQDLKALHASGDLARSIETNPYRAMTIHTRSVANQHADAGLTRYMTRTHGKPSRIVDRKGLEAVRKVIPKAQEAVDALKPVDTEGFEKARKLLVEQHIAQMDKGLKDTLADQKAQIRHHLEELPHTSTTKATVARISNRRLNAPVAHRNAVKAIRDGNLPPSLKREINKINKAEKARYKDERLTKKQLSSLKNMETKLAKGVKNADLDPSKTTTVKGIVDENGKPMVFPTEIAGAIERLEKVMHGDDDVLNAFSNGYRKWLGKWKLAVTSVNPGYGVRNTLSDFWNMYIAGIPMSEISIQGAKAAKLMAAAKKGDVTARSIIQEAYDQGVLSGLFKGDVQQVATAVEQGGSKRALKRRPIKLTTKVMQDINANRENWGRLTHYLYRRDVQKMGASDAAFEVKKAHFDYEDLTEFEQKRMKVVAPFYTWSRKNIPFQIQQLASRPGKYAAFPKAAFEMDEAAGGSEGEIVPEYMRNGMYLKMPFGGGKYMAPMIGVTDLNRVTNPVQGALGLVTPALKVPVELATNKNLLTGGVIKSTDGTSASRNPINDKLANLLKLIPGSDVGVTARETPEGLTQGAGANPYLTHILGTTPLTNTLINQTGEIRKAQREGDGNKAALSWLSGINATKLNQEQQQRYAQLEFADHVKQVMKDLRAQGIIPPADKRKTSAAQAAIDMALYKAMTGGG